jgi:hypothetical protein
MTATINPDTVAKAATLAVTPNGDGTWRVIGETGTYSIYRLGEGYRCTCPAGHGSTMCSHRIATDAHVKGIIAKPALLETLTAEEMSAMSLIELGYTLNTVSFAITALAEERQKQNTRFADLKIKSNRYKLLDEKEKLAATVDELLLQKSIVDNLRIRHSALRELKTSLQSTMRTVA